MTILLLPTATFAQEEACLYKDSAYSVRFIGCFLRVTLECMGHNQWVERGSCDSDTIPAGAPAQGLPGSFEGQLCNAGGYYSPEAEGCIARTYQQCQTTGQWAPRQPIEGAGCQ